MTVLTDHPWRDPLEVLAPLADEPHCLALLSDGSEFGRWSYVCWAPVAEIHDLASLRDALGRRADQGSHDPDHPPFRGGAAGLATYEWGSQIDPAMPGGDSGWPPLSAGLYEQLLAFDHQRRRVWAIGEDAAQARRAAEALRAAPQPEADFAAATFMAVESDWEHAFAVGQVKAAIARGDFFQSNIARRWTGRLHRRRRPFDALVRLGRASPAPFAGYLRLPGLAVVSNSPERFLRVDPKGEVGTRPIKGTRPRGSTPERDLALAKELLASAKDRAENLMIVDLMRNDLARACRPGTVKVQGFCALESFANVHHLVSTVTGQLALGEDAVGLFALASPPGSVTGAPKIEAMKAIARHEPPRGPYCGSLFWAGFDGALDSNVLIRTAAFCEDARGWRFETRAGGGITSDSDPAEEVRETLAKIAALRSAFSAT